MKTAPRSNNRKDVLLGSAAELFSTRGYQASTIREIAQNCDMLPGSIYFHFANKEALLVAVYEEGVRRLLERVQQALMTVSNPWERLEVMLRTHIEMIVEPTAYASVIIRILPDVVPKVADDLIALRNRYEVVFRDLIGALDLPDSVDRRLVRLTLIGAANHVPVWYRPGSSNAAEIAAHLVSMVQASSQTPPNGETA